MVIKICTKCKIEKPIEEFFHNKRLSDGHYYNCKECVRKYSKKRAPIRKKCREKYYQKNKVELRAKQKIYNLKNPRTEHKRRWRLEHKDYIREYNLIHKEKINENRRKRYPENKDKISKRHKKYYAENREKVRKKAQENYLINKDKIKRQNNKYRLENQDKILKYMRLYERENREKIIEKKRSDIDNLTDSYLRGEIKRRTGMTRKNIPVELIVSKRCHIMIKRYKEGRLKENLKPTLINLLQKQIKEYEKCKN